ncbi:MAG: hypothetical protein JNG84_10910 [Archangium sp.]|nr:hypothetical protein [Archangium sp.]
MTARWARMVAFGCVVAASTSEAGLLSALSKLGKAGSTASKVSKVAKMGKVAAVGKAAAGLTAAVAAERAGVVFARFGDDAAKSAAYIARGAEGELVMVTRAAGQSTHDASSLSNAVGHLGGEGAPSKVLVDMASPPSAEALATLPNDVAITLVDDATSMPVRRVEKEGVSELVVDTAEGAIDLADYLGASDSDEGDEGISWPAIGIIVVVVGGLFWRGLRSKEDDSATPA